MAKFIATVEYEKLFHDFFVEKVSIQFILFDKVIIVYIDSHSFLLPYISLARVFT